METCDGYSMELYFVRFAACNTGISLLLHNSTAVSSSKMKNTTNKRKNSHIFGCACAPTPAFFFRCTQLVAHVMVSEENSEKTVS